MNATTIERARVRRLSQVSEAQLQQLADVLIDCVDGGASVSFMHPLPRDSRPGSFDLAADVDDLPGLSIFHQTDNGLMVPTLQPVNLRAEAEALVEFYDALAADGGRTYH